MDNNDNIKLDNGWATTEVSPDGVITVTIKKCANPTVHNFAVEEGGSVSSSKDKVVIKGGHGGSYTFTNGSPQQSLEDQAKEAIRKGDSDTLRDLIDKQGLSASTVIPETGRTLLQELCVTGSDEGFALCLRVLLVRGADTHSRVSGTDETILHLLAEHGSLCKWGRAINELGKSLIDELLCATDNEGNTPLHIAAGRGRMDIYALVIGLCGPDSKQSELENKHGHKPYEVLNANRYSDMAYAEESQCLMLRYMTRYFNNLVHHRPLYTKDETEQE